MNGAVLYGKINESDISVHLTGKAMENLLAAKTPIYVGMELYFTSFVQKKVVFLNEAPQDQVTKIADNLYMYFKPIQPKTSKIKDLNGQSAEMIELPVSRKGGLVPKYIKIDYNKGNWCGDFTWKSGNKYLKPLIFNYN